LVFIVSIGFDFGGGIWGRFGEDANSPAILGAQALFEE
jgi:hypothetical protein